MHSRIIQVSTEPIAENDYIESANYYESWFLSQIADYTSDKCNRIDDINWLKRCCTGVEFGRDENGDYLVVLDKKQFFESDFSEFKKAIDEADSITIEDFVNVGASYKAWKVYNTFEEKHGFYIDEDDELETLQSWMRMAEVGIKYYIGGTVDYHC